MQALILVSLLVPLAIQDTFVESEATLIAPFTAGDNFHTPFPTSNESIWALGKSSSIRFDPADAALIRFGIIRIASESRIGRVPMGGRCITQDHKYLTPVIGFVNGKLFIKILELNRCAVGHKV